MFYQKSQVLRFRAKVRRLTDQVEKLVRQEGMNPDKAFALVLRVHVTNNPFVRSMYAEALMDLLLRRNLARHSGVFPIVLSPAAEARRLLERREVPRYKKPRRGEDDYSYDLFDQDPNGAA